MNIFQFLDNFARENHKVVWCCLILYLCKALEGMVKNVERLRAMPSSNNRLEGGQYCTLCLYPGEIKVVSGNCF